MFKVTKIKPVANHIVTTMEMYSNEEMMQNGLYDGTKMNTIKEYQKVLEVGPMARDVKPGDIVRINPARYVQILHKQGKLRDADKKIIEDDMHAAVDIPKELLYTKEGGVETSQWVMILFDSDVMCVVEGEEFNQKIVTESPLYIPPGGIVKN